MFLTGRAVFFILIAHYKNTADSLCGRTEDTLTDKKLISSLQGLRAVAFLSVVLSHCGAPWLGPWAITVFVALSGFLMTCNYYDRPRTAPGLRSAIAFSLKKIRKLYPLHLIMMAAALLFVLKGLLAQPSARGVLSCAAQLVVSIFLLQTWIPSSRFWFCLNGVAWYLSVQAFLYAIFPPLLAVLKKADVRRLRCIAAVIFCAQCLASFVFWKAGLSGKAAFYLTYLCPVFRAGDFTISCCMGCLYHSRKQESGLPDRAVIPPKSSSGWRLPPSKTGSRSPVRASLPVRSAAMPVHLAGRTPAPSGMRCRVAAAAKAPRQGRA